MSDAVVAQMPFTGKFVNSARGSGVSCGVRPALGAIPMQAAVLAFFPANFYSRVLPSVFSPHLEFACQAFNLGVCLCQYIDQQQNPG